ncbi:MAG TPA: hypothetical protein VMT68_01790 [Caulobacteraceae bacterium]|nr:hypothetical protein [Caulobacteraceae bacterium]
MSITRSNTVYRTSEHFEPDASLDPQAQKRLRGHLEQIDYTAYASNREIIAHLLGAADPGQFQRLAVMVAQARAGWVKAAVDLADRGRPLGAADTARLAELRAAYVELTEAYDAMRRLVERGYLTYAAK